MQLKYTLLLLCVPLIGGASAFSQNLVWRERAPLPLPRSGFMAGNIGGKYVVAGGSYWVGKQKHWTAEVDVFDPARNTWGKTAPLPEPRSDAASVVYGGILYVFGGGAGKRAYRDALEFHNQKWSRVPGAQLPAPRVYSVAVACKGMVYLVGGLAETDESTAMSNALWAWNPKTPQEGWKVLPPMPGPGLMAHAVASVNGKVYVLGGAKRVGKGVENVKTVFEFDPATGKWNQLGDLPIGRRCWWGIGLSNKILLLGGYTTTYERGVFTYQLASGNLVDAGTMPHVICAAKFVHIGNAIIGTGGEVGPGVRGKWTIEAHLRQK